MTGRVSASGGPISDEQRYEVSLFIGPCPVDVAEAFAEAVMELPEFKAVFGGAVGLRVWTDDDDAALAASAAHGGSV